MVLAIFSLAQPWLTPVVPDLAGWAPNHGHVYTNGEVAPHSHPWDRGRAEPLAPGNVPPGFIFHLCEIHPDGLVPVGDAVEGESVSGPAASSGASGEEDVVFLFDLNRAGSVLPAPEAPVLGCHGASFAANVAVPMALAGSHTSPTVPPPRA
ncbi:MAG: hypothetical protein M0R73_13800 [Dehalococcoidia bacterium]|nr:hypothetical protein [Dehalococcoidia bacterium]